MLTLIGDRSPETTITAEAAADLIDAPSGLLLLHEAMQQANANEWLDETRFTQGQTFTWPRS